MYLDMGVSFARWDTNSSHQGERGVCMKALLGDASTLFEELEQFTWMISHVYARKLPGYGVDDFFGDGLVGLCVAYERYRDRPWDELVLMSKETIKNHIKKSFVSQYWPQRARPVGHFIDLTEVVEKVGIDAFSEVYAREYFHHVEQMLTEFSKVIFQFYLNVPGKFIDRMAIKNARKLHLREQGHSVRLSSITAGEVANFLQVNRAQVDSSLFEIRRVLESTKDLIRLRG